MVSRATSATDGRGSVWVPGVNNVCGVRRLPLERGVLPDCVAQFVAAGVAALLFTARQTTLAPVVLHVHGDGLGKVGALFSLDKMERKVQSRRDPPRSHNVTVVNNSLLTNLGVRLA